MFSEVGLPVTALSGDVEAVLRASDGAAERGAIASMRLAARELPRIIQTWTKETLDACAGVEVVTGGIGGMVIGLSVAEKVGARFIEAHLQPIGAPTDAYPGLLLPGVPRWLGGWGRRLSQRLSESALWMGFRGPMRTARKKVLGLSGEPNAARGQPVLYGFSRHVVPVPTDTDRPRFATGYWVLPTPEDWVPPPALEAFLARKGTVVTIGFGSMASRDAEALTQLVLGAVRKAGVRAVLVAGWGGLTAAASGDDVFFADSLPYEWLFPRVAAVVHHGGAGTTRLPVNHLLLEPSSGREAARAARVARISPSSPARSRRRRRTNWRSAAVFGSYLALQPMISSMIGSRPIPFELSR